MYEIHGERPQYVYDLLPVITASVPDRYGLELEELRRCGSISVTGCTCGRLVDSGTDPCDRETVANSQSSCIALVAFFIPLTCYNPLRGLPGAFSPFPFTLLYEMQLLTIFGFFVLLAGQGMIHWPYAAPRGVLTMCFTQAALALNIVIGGSVGNVTADQFLTVQDNDLTTKVRRTELLDFCPC